MDNNNRPAKPISMPPPRPLNLDGLSGTERQMATAAHEQKTRDYCERLMAKREPLTSEEQRCLLRKFPRGTVPVGPDEKVANVLDSEPNALSVPGRNSLGQFAPNHGGFKPKGSLRKLTTAMRQAAVERMAAEPRLNPLQVLIDVMETTDDLKLKAECADRLARHLWGVKTQLELETPDPVDEERIERTRRMIAGLFVVKSEETTSA